VTEKQSPVAGPSELGNESLGLINGEISSPTERFLLSPRRTLL
jgi:hypothetical protein